MSDLFVSLIVVVITGIVVALIFIFVGRTKKQREIGLKNLADLHGWTFEPIQDHLEWGFRLRGSEWVLEAVSKSSSHSPEPSQMDVTQSTRIWTPGFSASGDLVLIGPCSGSIPDFGGLGKMLINKMVDSFLGRHDMDLQMVDSGSQELHKHYLVLAAKPQDAEKVLTSPVEKSLLTWKGTLPVIKINSKGLQIDINGQHYKTEKEITALVDLTELLLTFKL